MRGKVDSRVPLLFSTPGIASVSTIEYIAMLQRCPLCMCSYRYNTALISHIAAKHSEQAELCLHEATMDKPTTDDQADASHELEEYQSEP
jgi:hypothetical protein